VSYVCDSCETEIEEVDEENRCMECGQVYAFDPTETDGQVDVPDSSPAQQETDARDTEETDSGQRQQELEQAELTEETQDRVLWKGSQA